MPKKKPTKVYRYDGQSIWTTPDLGYPSYSDYELGSFLGGGAAGVVYEAECLKTKRRLAVKVLNPIGYKLAPSGSLRFCEVVVKGQPYGDVGGGRGSRCGSQGLSGAVGGGGVGGVGGVGWGPSKMSEKHVWWLVNASTRQMFAAYYDARTGMLKEMTLPKCIEVWGLGDDKGRRRERKKDRERDRIRQEERLDRVFVEGEWLPIPSAPAKYDKFLRARASILREINNMLQLSEHPNILRLHEALELVQDSKATIFLVLELARGGELFDRIKVDCGADEGAARHYFRQLLSGVRHCHDRGVCHRDLKPENLLLANPDDSSVLKIADFGFSALFRELESESSSGDDSSGSTSAGGLGLGPAALRRQASSGLSSRGSRTRSGAGGARAGTGSSVDGRSVKGPGVRRLMSVVGSPYYVAPEVLREDTVHGYDGTKADVWSMGVILYAMLAGNLPFEKELLTCPRFAKFGTWARQSFATASLRAHSSGNPKDAMDMDCLDYPSWFYPQHFSFAARSLLSGLLHPDASSRLSVHQALRHPWVRDGRLYTRSGGSGSSDGSDFGVGAERGDGERHAPDPQDIPTELLGADSDLEEEEDLGSLLGRKGNRNQNETRGGHCPRARRPSPAVVSRSGRQDGGYALCEVGVSGTTLVAEAVAATAANATSVAVNVTSGGSFGGVSEESSPSVATVVVGSKKKVVDATPGFRRGVGVVRQASPPKPAPPPSVPVPAPAPRPPPPSAGRLVATQSTSASSTTTPAEDEEEVGHRTRVWRPGTATTTTPGGSGDVKTASGITVVSSGTTSRGEGGGLTSGESNSSGIAVHLVDDADQCLRPGSAVLGEGVVTVAATPTTAAVAAEAAAEEEAAAKEAAATRAAKSTATGGGGLVTVAVAVAVTPRSPSPVTSRKPFVTPTKTTSSPRPLDVFSSPPLAPVGSGMIAEEDGSEFLLDAGQSPSAYNRTSGRTWRSKSRDGLPPSGAGHPMVGGAPQALGTVDRTLSMGVAGMTIAEAEADAEEGLQEDLMTTPPAFNDLVKRSTRFMTSVPAAVVLLKIATIINADAHPLPYPYRNIRQKAIVHQGEYKLEIMRGGVLVCTVQIYLLGGEQRAAQYMVEFLRGQLDIFLFKRFYEDVRCKLNDLVKRDYSLALLDSGVCTNRLRRFSNLA